MPLSYYGAPLYSSYSNPYSLGPYANHSSIIAANYGRSPTSSYTKPLTRLRSGFTPFLATISEAHAAARPMTRITSPKVVLHSSPKFKMPRPISINTADIDVSVNKYRKFKSITPRAPDKSELKKEPEKISAPSTTIETESEEKIPGKFPIKRDRALVRLHTIHRRSKDKQPEQENNNQPKFTRKWRDAFEEEKKPVKIEKKAEKSPAERLLEKHLIKDKTEEEKLRLIEEQKIKRRRNLKEHTEENKELIRKSPSFHDICESISLDNISEDLNPGQPEHIKRRQTRQLSTEDILQHVRKNSTEFLNDNVIVEKLGMKECFDKPNEESDLSVKNREDTRTSVKRKKKITRKKTNENLEEVIDDLTPKSPLQRRPTLKKIKRTSTDRNLPLTLELDERIGQDDQNSIRDISQVEVEEIKVKSKPVITSSVDVESTKANLKAIIVDDVYIEEIPTVKSPKFKLEFTIHNIEEYEKSDSLNEKDNLSKLANISEKQLKNKQIIDVPTDLQNKSTEDVPSCNKITKVIPKKIEDKLKTEEKIKIEAKSKIEEKLKTEEKPKIEGKPKTEEKRKTEEKPKIEEKPKRVELEIEEKPKTIEKPKIEEIHKADEKFKIEEQQKIKSKLIKSSSFPEKEPKEANVLTTKSDSAIIKKREEQADLIPKTEPKEIVDKLTKKEACDKKLNSDKKLNEKKVEIDKSLKIIEKLEDKKNLPNQPNKTNEKIKLNEVTSKSIVNEALKIKHTSESSLEIEKSQPALNKIEDILNDESKNKTPNIEKLRIDILKNKSKQLEIANQINIIKQEIEKKKKKTDLPIKEISTNDAMQVPQSTHAIVSKAVTKKHTARLGDILEDINTPPPRKTKPKVMSKSESNEKIVTSKNESAIEKSSSTDSVNFWDQLGTRESVQFKNRPVFERRTETEVVPEIKESPEDLKITSILNTESQDTKSENSDKISDTTEEIKTIEEVPFKVFIPPEEEPEPEPCEEEKEEGKFVPLQSNRLSDWMHPFQRPVQLEVCPVEIYAKPKVIRGRHYPRPKHPPSSAPDLKDDSSDSDSSESEDTSEEESDSSQDETNASSTQTGTSTSSNDSGFDSSAPGSPSNRRYDNGSSENRDSPSSNPALNPAFAVDSGDTISEDILQSCTFTGYQKSGRITPPATTMPRFRKYTIDDFQFLKVLGKGSFGKVMLAELKNTEYYYAVKCLKKDVVLEDDDVECTLIERKVLALGTKHPYLCHLLCTFQTESHLFFIMEYLNGGDLMFHIQQSGRFAESRAKFYAAEIASGLRFLHSKGIVYRDLKLDNILLDFDGHVRIADFGMCKLQIFLDRTADTFCGTPDYMAPEIIKGQHYNQCVDWWSYGVLLYEMLIGQSPFSGCDEDELFWSICNEKPVIPRFLSSEANSILLLLLEKDAGKRLGNRMCPSGIIQDQPFFKAIDWDRLEARLLEPPFKPKLQHPLDTQYFDKTFTVEKAKLTPIEKNILQSMDQTQFQGFSYTNPNATDK